MLERLRNAARVLTTRDPLIITHLRRRATAVLSGSARGAFAKSIDPSQGGWKILEGVQNAFGWLTAGTIWEKKLGNLPVQLEQLNAQQSAVYACVRRICTAAQEAPPMIGRRGPDGWEDLPDHPAASLLAAPNPRMSYAEFLYHYLLHLQLTGETLIWKWRARAGGPVTEMWPVPTSWANPILDPRLGTRIGYTIWLGNGRSPGTILGEDMLRIHYPDPSSLDLALGPLQAALRDARVDEARQDYQMEMLVNNKRPGMILYQPEDWGPDQKDEVRAVFTQGLGDGNRGRTVFMQGEGAKVDAIPPIAELDWPGLTGLSETRICGCFGVPPIVVGLRAGLEHATYSNYEQALRAFYQGTLVSIWNMLDASLTRGLLRSEPAFNGDPLAEIYHDTSDVRGLQESAVESADRATKLFAGSLITRDEGREMAGLDKLGPERGGDVFVTPISLVESTPGEPAEPAAPPDTGAAANASL